MVTAEELVQHYKEDPWDGNYMITREKFKDIC